MITSTKENHALTNCMNHLESIKELYRNYLEADLIDEYDKHEEIRDKAYDEALSVEFRSGWSSKIWFFRTKNLNCYK